MANGSKITTVKKIGNDWYYVHNVDDEDDGRAVFQDQESGEWYVEGEPLSLMALRSALDSAADRVKGIERDSFEDPDWYLHYMDLSERADADRDSDYAYGL